MFVIFGFLSAGRIHTDQGRLVSTEFFHVFFVPVFPLKSILVTERHLVRDVGQRIGLNGKSVLAAYLRVPLLALVCLGFMMAAGGLFEEGMDKQDRQPLLVAGTAILTISYTLWLWAMFAFGAPRVTEAPQRSPTFKMGMGLLVLALALAGMLAGSVLYPTKPTLRDIELDRTLSDEAAILKMSRTAFPEGAQIEISPENDGIELSVAYVKEDRSDLPVLPGPNAPEPDELNKGLLVSSLHFDAKNVAKHGQSRGLSRIRVSLLISLPERGGSPVEAYRVNIPQEKFEALVREEESDGPIDFIGIFLSSGKELQELGVVEVDRFSDFAYRKKQ